MTIGIGQIFIILLVIFLLFGNLSAILKDFSETIKMFQKFFKDKSKN